ncbi:lipase esterase protein [Rutstroemia sp. NJR-2017a WRK4]|nr:lipase esterase protein [Rutstroemia sp. NJR-2017a WRK4]
MDTSSPIALVKTMIPKMPLVGKTALMHTLGMSEHCHHWDLRTELTVNVLRSFTCGEPQPISRTQRVTLQDPSIKGKMWVSKAALIVPVENDVRRKLFQAIEEMKEPGEPRGGFTEPKLVPVEAEWTGYRAGATSKSVPLKIPESQQYEEMMKEVTTPVTILYIHGGAHWMLDPATYRDVCKKLAKLCGGRVLSLRYRLAPQNPFPAALLDCLVAYLNLLYPPPGSFHTPVSASHVVFSGDSAGGNLSLALLQLLLHFQRTHTTITWNGQAHEIPVPAGLALNSPWADITCSSPSHESNSKYDYIPPPSFAPNGMTFPPCSIWPTEPPRSNIYVEDALICHPLVSPLSAKSWAGAPPMHIITGQELLADEDKTIASKAASQGVVVRYEEYEAMPHCFALLLAGLGGTRRCFTGWGKFCREVVVEREGMETTGVRIRAKTLQEEVVDVRGLWKENDEVVVGRMKEKAKVLGGKAGNEMAKL